MTDKMIKNRRLQNACTTVRVIVLAFMMMFSMPPKVVSQTMKDLWIAMPDSLFPYLNQSLRSEGVALAERNLDATVVNLLKEKTRIDTLSADYMAVTMSKSMSLQMRLLPSEQGDSVLCIVKRYCVPETESTMTLYARDWKRIETIAFDVEKLVSRPDTMSVSKYQELLKLLDPYMISASLSASDDVLTVAVDVANVSEEERKDLVAILPKRKFRWNGKNFLPI